MNWVAYRGEGLEAHAIGLSYSWGLLQLFRICHRCEEVREEERKEEKEEGGKSK